jgi:nucleotide-binding universal stress UspA family protein
VRYAYFSASLGEIARMRFRPPSASVGGVSHAIEPERRLPVAESVFGRILCGIDGTAPALRAARQAARLLAPEGELVFVSVCETHLAVHGGVHAGEFARELERAAEEALQAALPVAPRAETRLVRGVAPQAMLELAERERATLVAVGAQGFGRGAGIMLGSLPTRLLHDAPCSVLVARGQDEAEAFPRAVAVGIDGSPESLAAAEAAAEAASRLGASVRYMVATGGKPVDVDRLAASAYELEFTDWKPIEALVGVSDFVDLVVVGSRGLHGVRALGSVSERVAHRARASVLVVRPRI